MKSRLKVKKKYLGSMYETVSEIWNKRADISPIPEITHLANGWAKDNDNEEFSIRDEIIKSLQHIEEKSKELSPNYKRRSSQTAQQYLFWLKKQKGISLSDELLEQYLSFYNSARYGPSNIIFTLEDFAVFQQSFDDVEKALSKSLTRCKSAD